VGHIANNGATTDKERKSLLTFFYKFNLSLVKNMQSCQSISTLMSQIGRSL